MTMAAMATTGTGAIFRHDNDAAPHATPTTMTIPIPPISKFLI